MIELSVCLRLYLSIHVHTCTCACTHTHTHTEDWDSTTRREWNLTVCRNLERTLEGIMLNEIPQICRFHAEPTKWYMVNRTEQNRSRVIDTTKEHIGGGQKREGRNWWWGWSWGENEWVPLVRETDKAVQPSTYETIESQVSHDTKYHLPWHQVVMDSH